MKQKDNTMKTFTAVFLLSLAVKDCSAAALEPGTCVAEAIGAPPTGGTCLLLPAENNCTKPLFFANITVPFPICTCECDIDIFEICCDTKTVGDYSYTKDSVGTVPENCLNNCIYSRDDKPGSKYCFASGEQEVHCLDSTDGTEIPDTELPEEANVEGESCRIVTSGPVGGYAPKEFLFNDRTVAKNGKITQIAFRFGSLMDQIQATYGNIFSLPHGGSGGVPTGPYVLQGSDIIKVEGTVITRQAQPYIQSVKFTDQSGRVHGPFGPTNEGSRFEFAPNDCFLRYLSGSTTGNDTQASLSNFETFGNYVNQLTFNWCCPK